MNGRMPHRGNAAACLAVVLTAAAPPCARAATEQEKAVAIDSAIQWLLGHQQADGRWQYREGSREDQDDIAVTGATLVALLEKGLRERDYEGAARAPGDAVGRGLDYLFEHAIPMRVPPEHDFNNNGFCVRFSGVRVDDNFAPPEIRRAPAESHDMYITSFAAMAVVRTGTPAQFVRTPRTPLARAIPRPEWVWTYRDVIADVHDYFSYCQTDSGGWGYTHRDRSGDNSNAQWPPTAMVSFPLFKVPVAPELCRNLGRWIEAVQARYGGGGLLERFAGRYGGSGYTPGDGDERLGLTGGMLIEMYLADSAGAPARYGRGSAQREGALDFVFREWRTLFGGTANIIGQLLGQGGREESIADIYAFWSVYKGLELTLGLDDPAIERGGSLRDRRTARGGGPAPLDPGDTWNWWEDLCDQLVVTQRRDGSWSSSHGWYPPVLTTAWCVSILKGLKIEEFPSEIPTGTQPGGARPGALPEMPGPAGSEPARKGAVEVLIFLDRNGNGLLDTAGGESGKSGQALILEGARGEGRFVKVSGADGKARFLDLAPGSYRLQSFLAPDQAFSRPPPAEIAVGPGETKTLLLGITSQGEPPPPVATPVPAGEPAPVRARPVEAPRAPEQPAADAATASVEVLVFLDLDGDGVLDAAGGETVKKGQVISLQLAGAAERAVKVTGADGVARFAGLLPGRYEIKALVRASETVNPPLPDALELGAGDRRTFRIGIAERRSPSGRVTVLRPWAAAPPRTGSPGARPVGARAQGPVCSDALQRIGCSHAAGPGARCRARIHGRAS